MHPREHPREGFVDRQQRRHRAHTLTGVISVIVPVHDEERSVALLHDELASSLGQLDEPWEVVFVDDGSTDGTFSALTRLHAAHDNVRVVRLRRNFGKATALQAGFAEAQGDVVVTIDGDLQDDPAEIPRLLAKLEEGFDLVSGWKTKRRDPLTRRIPSRIFNAVTGQALGAAAARPQLRAEGLPRGRREGDANLRRAPSLHPGAGALPRLSRRRAAGEPPSA